MKNVMLLLLLTGCGMVVVLPNNSNDLFEKNKHLLGTSNNQVFIETTAVDIAKLDFDEIYLFANWCPYCYSYLKDFHIDTERRILLVSTNYDIPYLNKHFPSVDTFYILSNSRYGSNESDKILLFTSELLKSDTNLVNGVPQRFYRNNDTIMRMISQSR